MALGGSGAADHFRPLHWGWELRTPIIWEKLPRESLGRNNFRAYFLGGWWGCLTQRPFPLIQGWKWGQVNVKVTLSDPLSCLFLGPGLQSPAEKPSLPHPACIWPPFSSTRPQLGGCWSPSSPRLTRPLILPSDFSSLLGTLLCRLAWPPPFSPGLD